MPRSTAPSKSMLPSAPSTPGVNTTVGGGVLKSRLLMLALMFILAELEMLWKVMMPFSASYSGCEGEHLPMLSLRYDGMVTVMVLKVGMTFFSSAVTFTSMLMSDAVFADIRSRISKGTLPRYLNSDASPSTLAVLLSLVCPADLRLVCIRELSGISILKLLFTLASFTSTSSMLGCDGFTSSLCLENI